MKFPISFALLLALAACDSSPATAPVAPAPATPQPVVQAPPPPPPAPPESFEIKVGRVKKNQTLATTLNDLGLPMAQVNEVVGALSGVFDFRKSRVGDQIRITTKAGQVELVEYRKSAVDEWYVRREGERMVGGKRAIEVEKRVATVALTIDSSLYESMVDAGEDPTLAIDIADVLAWDVDFYQDVRKGDRVKLVVEKYFSKGRLLRYGDILAVRYAGEAVKDRTLFRYVDAKGEATFFDKDGNSAKKAFLKTPLKYAVITSRFGMRNHPMLNYQQAHQGVDYSAAIGTPVWAVADGVVTRVVYGDKGGGNFLFLRHGNGMETGYLHLSKFGEGIKVGAHVRQKQVVAYTGNTGMSTGPHLHYAMKRGGQYINPLTVKFPRPEPLPKAELPRFGEQIADVRTMIEAGEVAALTH